MNPIRAATGGTRKNRAEVWLADETLRDRTAAVSYHTGWNDDFDDYDAMVRTHAGDRASFALLVSSLAPSLTRERLEQARKEQVSPFIVAYDTVIAEIMEDLIAEKKGRGAL